MAIEHKFQFVDRDSEEGKKLKKETGWSRTDFVLVPEDTTAHLYKQQLSIGAIAVAQGCCEASLQSSTEQQGSYSALTSSAVHWSSITPHLCEQQFSIGAIAVAQGLNPKP